MATNKEIHEYLFKGGNLPNSVTVADQDKYLTLLARDILTSPRKTGENETVEENSRKKIEGFSDGAIKFGGGGLRPKSYKIKEFCRK